MKLTLPVNKYRAKRTVVDGLTFHSAGEARRYQELCLMQKAGTIADLTLQPHYPIVVGGQLVCTYIADFRYISDEGCVVEDFKGFKTPVFRLKAKLFKALYPALILKETHR